MTNRLEELKKEEAKWLNNIKKASDTEENYEEYLDMCIKQLNYTRCRIDELEKRNKEILDVLNIYEDMYDTNPIPIKRLFRLLGISEGEKA